MVSTTLLEGFDPLYIFKSKLEFKNWLLSHIDLTFLPPYLPDEKLREFLDKANVYGFKRVCIPLTAVSKAREILSGKSMIIITFISSFHGNRNTPDEKLNACSSAMSLGADEIEFSPDLSLLNDENGFKKESQDLVDLIRGKQKISKLYLEIDKLPEELTGVAIKSAGDTNPDYISIAIKLKEEESYDGENLNISKEWLEKVNSAIKEGKKANLKVYGRISSFNTLLPILYLATKYGWDIQALRIGTEFGFDIIDGMDTSEI